MMIFLLGLVFKFTQIYFIFDRKGKQKFGIISMILKDTGVSGPSIGSNYAEISLFTLYSNHHVSLFYQYSELSITRISLVTLCVGWEIFQIWKLLFLDRQIHMPRLHAFARQNIEISFSLYPKRLNSFRAQVSLVDLF